MSLRLQTNEISVESIETTLPVPVSLELKRDIDALKKACGKPVNKKIREFLKQLVAENQDKIKKAS